MSVTHLDVGRGPVAESTITVLPREAPDFATAWTRVAATMLPDSTSLRTSIMSGRERGGLMDAMRDMVRIELGEPVHW